MSDQKQEQIELEGYDAKVIEDVGFMTATTMILLGNYSQSGHFGGPMSYTPANVVAHLGLASNGGLRYDIRHPKHPYSDKFNLTGGHSVPTCYALWMILYESMARQYALTGDEKYKVDPNIGIYGIDALGFRRSPDAVKTLLQENNLADNPVFDQAKIRGIRALMGHSETTDVTNDVNGGPSGIGASTTAGKAIFWNAVGAPEALKVMVFEGEFAFTEGHAQELKTIALANQVGKRLRFFFSFNNAGIDDNLIAPPGGDGVIPDRVAKYYNICDQFKSYGWNVFEIEHGNDYAEVLKTFKAMEDWPVDDVRPMVAVAKTLKGWFPGAVDGKIMEETQKEGFKTHPYNFPTNSPYFLAMAETFERRFGVQFEGIRDGKPADEAARLIQFKQNIDICMSVLDKNDGFLRKWVCDRLMAIADDFHRSVATFDLRYPVTGNPFEDGRLKPENLPKEPLELSMKHPTTGETITKQVKLFETVGTNKGTRRAISECGKWINYVTGNRYFTNTADLSGSLNVEGCNWLGHYDPIDNPLGTRLKAGIQETGNAAAMCGLISQTLSMDPSVHNGMAGVTGTYGAFTPLFYTPLRVYSQQNQDSPFALGVFTVVCGHSGPETAADARTHFGIFAPQIWNLFPEGQAINLHFSDYNDVAPGYFAALHECVTKKESSIIIMHMARPDVIVADRSNYADKDPLAATRGCYVIREYEENKEKHGTILVQGCSSTVNLLAVLPELEAEGINIRVVAVVSEDLFRIQSEEYKNRVMPASAYFDCMVVTTGTKRVMPLPNLGPLTKEYTMSSDWDDRWRTGGTEPDVLTEAHLDPPHIKEGILRFARDRATRLQRMRDSIALL